MTDAVAPLEGATASVVVVMTSEGPARAVVHAPSTQVQGRLVLGHGAGGRRGTNTADLVTVAQVAVRLGWAVVLVDQPWVVAGGRVAVAPPRLDVAWTAVLERLRADEPVVADGTPLVVGGRSAGARVACRTAAPLGAVGVLALAFPLRPPSRSSRGELGRSRSGELPQDRPVLVVQGERDRFGSPADVSAAAGADVTVAGLRGDHSLRQDLDGLGAAVLPWLSQRAGTSPGVADAAR